MHTQHVVLEYSKQQMLCGTWRCFLSGEVPGGALALFGQNEWKARSPVAILSEEQFL